MSKRNKLIHRVVTVLFSIMILIGCSTYALNYDLVATRVAGLGYPPYIIIPLGILKVLGLIAIWTNKSMVLKEWAYAGFVFVLVLGTVAHVAINDNEYAPAFISLILAIASYVFHRKEQSDLVVNKTV